mgnify:CR=1 FL=1
MSDCNRYKLINKSLFYLNVSLLIMNNNIQARLIHPTNSTSKYLQNFKAIPFNSMFHRERRSFSNPFKEKINSQNQSFSTISDPKNLTPMNHQRNSSFVRNKTLTDSKAITDSRNSYSGSERKVLTETNQNVQKQDRLKALADQIENCLKNSQKSAEMMSKLLSDDPNFPSRSSTPIQVTDYLQSSKERQNLSPDTSIKFSAAKPPQLKQLGSPKQPSPSQSKSFLSKSNGEYNQPKKFGDSPSGSKIKNRPQHSTKFGNQTSNNARAITPHSYYLHSGTDEASFQPTISEFSTPADFVEPTQREAPMPVQFSHTELVTDLDNSHDETREKLNKSADFSRSYNSFGKQRKQSEKAFEIPEVNETQGSFPYEE